MLRKIVLMYLLDLYGYWWLMIWFCDNEIYMGFIWGWRDFCLVEGFLEGDVCIFEFIELNKFMLLIYVFWFLEIRDSNYVIIIKLKRFELL